MKKITVDIGNSNIVIGIYEQKWEHIWRLPTHKKPEKFDYALRISDMLFENEICTKDVEYVIISSVVPEITKDIFNFFDNFSNQTFLFDKKDFELIPHIKIDNPEEIGTDLVANAVAGYDKFKEATIIVDFGTALTFTVVDEKGSILGVNIAPGIKSAINTLYEKTSQLDKVPIEFPEHPLGKNTTEAIQNGILIGYEGLIEQMLKVIENYYQKSFKIIFTGGLSHLYEKRITFDKLDKNLTLNGLLSIGNKIYKKNNNSNMTTK